MQENAINAPAEAQDEISRALNILKKHGYQVNAVEAPSGELSIDFKFGSTEQTLKFTKDESQKKGAIEKRIVENLDI